MRKLSRFVTVPSVPVTTPDFKWLDAMAIHIPVWFLLFTEAASDPVLGSRSVPYTLGASNENTWGSLCGCRRVAISSCGGGLGPSSNGDRRCRPADPDSTGTPAKPTAAASH